MKIAALKLLAERVGQITQNTRKVIAAALSDIITQICAIINTPGNPAVLVAALGALRSIAIGATTLEEAALTLAVPAALAAGKGREALPAVLSALGPLT